MAEVEIPFATQEGKSASPQNSQEVLVNLYAEVETSGRTQLIRRMRPGINQYTAPDMFNVFYREYAQLVERFGGYHFLFYTTNGVATFTVRVFDGDFPPGPVETTLAAYEFGVQFGGGLITPAMLPNVPLTGAFNDNDELLLCDGQNLFFLDYGALANGAAVTTVDGASTCCSLAGFGVFNEPDSSRFYITGLNDFSTVGALDFADAESFKDKILRVFRLNNELVLFGETSTEFWQVTGGLDFPFAPITNAVLTRGIIGRFAVAGEDSAAFFVGDDLVVYRLQGFQPIRISNHPVERAIADLPTRVRKTCRAVTYTVEGHKFVAFTWEGYLTVIYDIATGLWSRAQSYGLQHFDLFGSASGSSSLYLSGGIIALLEPDQPYDDVLLETGVNGDVRQNPILWKAVSAPGWANGKRMTLNSLKLDIEVGRTAPFDPSTYGLGGTSTTVTQPRIMLRVARDGESFGNERARELGAEGNFLRQVVWRNMGQGRKPVLELSGSDPWNVKIASAIADLEVEA